MVNNAKKNTHLEGKYNCTADSMDGLDSTKQVDLWLFNIRKVAESKQVKQGVSYTMKNISKR